LALNAAAWVYSATNSFSNATYHDIVIVGLNAIIGAPVIVSLAAMYEDRDEVKLRYSVYYFSFLFLLIAPSTLFHIAIFISRSLGSENSDATFGEIVSNQELNDANSQFLATSITIITLSLAQIVFTMAIPILVNLPAANRLALDDMISQFGKRKQIIAFAVYSISIVSIALLEGLSTTISLTWEDGGFQMGFGQVYALALLAAPVFDLIHYFLEKSETLDDKRPIGYLCNHDSTLRRELLADIRLVTLFM
jgi:hypothetical protein